ncbi:MAG: tryptophan-rich sensory protein [Candidatus Nealsonbacteria bacterium]|nr:tryptophan-rich sensory protein [Candidatus Nealsonbacteria bacterium]
MKLNNLSELVVAVLVCEAAGLIGSVFTISAIPGWYAGLAKPALNPPGWLFGPVWTVLYALMGVSAWLVWKQWDQGSSSIKLRVKAALTIFGLQLFLNAVWSIIFFGLKNPGGALINIVLLWFAIVWTIVVFYKISKPAAYLLVPYLLWVSFASYLNYSIWALN